MLMLLVRTLLIYLVIILLMRLMGKRQLGELQPSELVSTILISNLASISIESPEIPLTASLAPVLLIVCLELLLSALCFKMPTAANLVSGRPVIVIRDGRIDQKALRALRFSIGDLMGALRAKDVFDPSLVSYALMETNGHLSVCLSGRDTRAANPFFQKAKKPPVPFILDGKLMLDNLIWCGKDKEWLTNTLIQNRCHRREVLLLLGDDTDYYQLIKKEDR